FVCCDDCGKRAGASAGVGGHAGSTGPGAVRGAELKAEENTIRSGMRSATDHLVTGLAILATVMVIAPLVAIFVYLLYKGASSLNLAFFTKIPKPVGEEGGGMAN